VAQPGGGVISLQATPSAAEMLAASPTAVLLVGPNNEIAHANSAAEILLNRSASHLEGHRFDEALNLPPSYDPEGEGAFAAYDIALSTPLPERLGWRLVSLQAGAAAHRIGHRLEGGGGVRTAAGIAATLAHEIKNPLSGIRGAAQLLDRSSNEDERRLTLLIRTEVDRIAALIDRMQGFSDDRPLELLPENIHAIIDHARAVATTGFGADLSIMESYDPSLPPVLVHRDSLTQIIINLLKNASETATAGERRKVTITTAYRHGVATAAGRGRARHALPVELCIIDDGPGAPPEIAENLFDPFVSSKPQSQGLGLALVDKLMRDMGGIVQYGREGRPEKTVLRLLLPRAPKELK
jgi:two-component system, NtrC family, nitrogen regulation sensor histidine kinase GlnL